ncbi:ankyrin repeat domain-containing protein [Wolbachia endosymbiont (group A) of Myopa testacea]|uniref:ankyrin repeat domain-containing protein n=1 Tax=Wolbachia endosymbiont (group A) of Myopa testacea TaxID=3066148 RepID=UPI0033404265
MSNVNEDIGNDLIQAAKKGDINEVRRLISEGANVNATDWLQETPLHFAAASGHKQVVQALLDKGANVNAEDEEGNTPLALTPNEEIKTILQSTDELLEAARKGDIDAVNRPINEGANVNATDWLQETPLHLAAVRGHKEVVEALLDKGANVDVQNDKGETPFNSATDKGIQNLLQGVKGANE